MSGEVFETGGLLPWESAAVFEAMRQSFHAHHAPQGPMEAALVDRLVWIEWRRPRLRLAERAAHMAGLADRIDQEKRTLTRAGVRADAERERLDLVEIVATSEADDEELARRHALDRNATEQALAILDRGGAKAYDRARAALHEETREWWEDTLAGEHSGDWKPEAMSLHAFLGDEVTPVDEELARSHAARGRVRLQAYGESLDPVRIDRLLAIEARLDRQFDKALSTLIQLQSLRAGRQASPPQSRTMLAPRRG